MKRFALRWMPALAGIVITAVPTLAADPRIDSWFTERSGQYARV